ncbi:MAG: Gfo/Idh/MocA family oxidoreductase [bacterium]
MTKSMDRRRFMKAGATVAAGVGVLRNARPGYSANETIQVAVVGINGQGRTHIRSLCSVKGARVVALCDPDERLYRDRVDLLKKECEANNETFEQPKLYPDIRELLEDDSVDAISIATCDHWHALATIWACQKRKDVYVEKPASWCISEGRRMVEAARKYDRIVQVGTGSRSSGVVRRAMELLHEGVIGDVFMARALCYKPRDSIGFKSFEKPPEGLHFDLWLGPAPEQAYHGNLVHYNWHWFWDFGTTDMGNQGVHQMDIARWGLRKELPTQVHGIGGRFGYTDQAETPNTQVSTFEYPDGTQLVFEVRGRYTNDESGVRIGNLFYGSKGYMVLSGSSYKVYLGRNENPEPDMGSSTDDLHHNNWIKAVRSRRREDLTADILEGHYSAALCHLGNISCRTGRKLAFDPEKEDFGGDREANRYLTRKYRKPFVVPKRV